MAIAPTKMSKISARKLEELIKKYLDEFYARRIAKLSGLNLAEALDKKNPYLFRAKGVQQASEIVSELLQAYFHPPMKHFWGCLLRTYR